MLEQPFRIRGPDSAALKCDCDCKFRETVLSALPLRCAVEPEVLLQVELQPERALDGHDGVLRRAQDSSLS